MAIEMEKAGKKAMKRLAELKAGKKSNASKVGERLDYLELSQAPRNSFLTKKGKK